LEEGNIDCLAAEVGDCLSLLHLLKEWDVNTRDKLESREISLRSLMPVASRRTERYKIASESGHGEIEKTHMTWPVDEDQHITDSLGTAN